MLPNDETDVDDIYDLALAQLDAIHIDFLRAAAGVSVEVMVTWPRFLIAARAIESNTAHENDLALLSKPASDIDKTVPEYAAIILRKDAKYVSLVAKSTSLRKDAEGLLIAARDGTKRHAEKPAAIRAALEDARALYAVVLSA